MLVSYSVIDEPQFLAFWQVNKQTTDVPKKKPEKNLILVLIEFLHLFSGGGGDNQNKK